jgi:choline-glycine betaine transporter
MSGLHAGVKFLSQLALFLGMVLTMLVFIMDDSKFLLNLIVQEVGYYFQWSIFRKFSAQTTAPTPNCNFLSLITVITVFHLSSPK